MRMEILESLHDELAKIDCELLSVREEIERFTTHIILLETRTGEALQALEKLYYARKAMELDKLQLCSKGERMREYILPTRGC
jgi:hypothetical protein